MTHIKYHTLLRNGNRIRWIMHFRNRFKVNAARQAGSVRFNYYPCFREMGSSTYCLTVKILILMLEY